MDAAAALTEWLSSADCRPALAGAAKFIYRQALRLALPSDLLPCTDPWQLPPDERADCFQALADDLWIFLRSRPVNWPLKSHWTILAARGPRFLMLKIAQEFLLHLRDKARTYGRDPARALYRRLRQVLQDEAEIVCQATGQGSFYSIDPDADPCESLQPFENEPYGQWDSPLTLVALRDLEKKSSLLILARFFWMEACRRLGKACFLPVRALVQFIAAHYCVPSTIFEASLSTSDADAAESFMVSPPELREECSGEVSFVARDLETLARRMAASWSERQRAVFCLVQGDGETLSEAARRLGYRSAAGAAYLHRSALDVLRDFCLLWPGLSPPDLDERLFEAFVLEVVAVCKNDMQGRINE
jgi:DNA-directed RNA polymerase specialized sigma24 family protein